MTADSYAFDGRTVLVTGGGSGIGRAIARAFLDNGALVAVVGRRRDKLEETLAGHEDRVLALPADIADRRRRAAWSTRSVARFGGLDVLVNNAARYLSKPFVEMTEQEWDDLRRTNVDAFVYLAQRALPELERTGGNLVAVGSVSGCAATGGSPATTRRRRWS